MLYSAWRVIGYSLVIYSILCYMLYSAWRVIGSESAVRNAAIQESSTIGICWHLHLGKEREE